MNTDDADSLLRNLTQESEQPTTDCAFVFDDEEIRAHKLVLTCCSPVFEKMFFGEMPSNRIIITDICSEDFRQMLKFIYTKSLRIKSVLHAWSLFYVAHKYLLDDFADACVNFIQENLNINNLVMNYEFAEMYGNKQLQSVCMSDVSDYVRGILYKCDYHMKATSLVMILEQKILNTSNEELVVGVLNWAVVECDIKKINLSPESIINLLNSLKILQYLINLEFKIDSNLDHLILKSCHLIKNFQNSNTCYKSYARRHWCIFCTCRQTYKISGRIEMRERDVIISNISVSRDCLLYGLVVVTENVQMGNQRNEYKGVIRMQISDGREIIADTFFSDNLPYDSSVFVPLNEVIYLEFGKIYSVKISYKNLDNNDLRRRKSSIVCNYMSNELIDKKKDVVFSFDELDGSVIRGISYYPV